MTLSSLTSRRQGRIIPVLPHDGVNATFARFVEAESQGRRGTASVADVMIATGGFRMEDTPPGIRPGLRRNHGATARWSEREFAVMRAAAHNRIC
jgi:hypothetical protein